MSTYTPIASVTLSSAQSSVTFSGIPQTYTDLVVVVDGATASSFGQLQMRINGDSGTTYSTTYVWGTGAAAVSDRDSNISGGMNPGFLGTGQGSNTLHIQNYTNTTTNKTVLARSSVPGNRVAATVNLWRSTAAINQIMFSILGGQNIASGSTFNLYGVANASITNVAKATGGDSVTTDGTYWYHTFRSSGTFTPTQALTCDYLVVAGGGGGGGTASDSAGGGGAGGLRCTVGATGGGGSLESALSLTASTNYTVTVGAGGAGGAGSDTTTGRGTSGSNSVFSSITSTGGGGGGCNAASTNGLPGGSGGGGGVPSGTGGAGTANQGYAGGNASASVSFQSGGGGGAGGAGANSAGTSGSGSAGGVGIATSISGVSTYYAGGGGGGPANSGGSGAVAGAGGQGGGGGGGTNNAAGVAGTANTGGGGGASNRVAGGPASGGGAGGSGIVIVRYSV